MGLRRHLRSLAIVLALAGVGTACCPTPAPAPPSDGGSGTATCPSGQACPSEVVVTSGDQTTRVSFGEGANDATLVVRVNPTDAPDFECPEIPRTTATVVVEFHFTGGDASDRDGYITTSFPSPNSEPDLSQYQTCWAASYPFLTRDSLATAGTQGLKPGTSDPLYVGVLPQCDLGDDFVLPAPCEQSKWYDSETNLIHISIHTTGADPWRY